jgi:hypothetical protein
MHMGDMAMRLRKVRPRKVSGEKSWDKVQTSCLVETVWPTQSKMIS